MFEISELLQYNLTLKDPYTLQFQAVSIPQKKACEIIQLLSEKYPFSSYNLPHLKRAKKSNCPNHLVLLIAPTEEIEDLSIFEAFTEDCEACQKFLKIDVPKIPPYTKAQLASWSRIWPSYLIQPSILPHIHTEPELAYLNTLFQQAKASHTILYIAGLDYQVIESDGAEPYLHSTFAAVNKFIVPDGQYLCSQAIAVLFEEPCIMCAMALVHSRIQQLYYCEDSETGAFSYHKLHERSLNYMYKIFKYKKT